MRRDPFQTGSAPGAGVRGPDPARARRAGPRLLRPLGRIPLPRARIPARAGLLAGRDVRAQLRGKALGEALLVPDVVLREGEDVFLDDVTLDDLKRELRVSVHKIASTPWGLLEAVEALAR